MIDGLIVAAIILLIPLIILGLPILAIRREKSEKKITHGADPFAFCSSEFRAQIKINRRIEELEERLKKIEGQK